MKLDGRLLTSRSKWLEPGSTWEQNISFTSDRVGERQKLEFLLFKDYVREKPYRYCHLWVSTEITYDNLEPLLRYGIDPLPAIRDGDMWQVYAKESEENLNVKVCWDDIEIRPINELVKVDERVRMKRYGW
jgi:hypothetical protein